MAGIESRSATARGGVARFFSRKILVTDKCTHGPAPLLVVGSERLFVICEANRKVTGHVMTDKRTRGPAIARSGKRKVYCPRRGRLPRYLHLAFLKKCDILIINNFGVYSLKNKVNEKFI